MNSFSSAIVANVYRVYDEKLLNDPDFMAGWRIWSFYKTRKGESATMDVKARDKDLILQMKLKGRGVNKVAYDEWNQFRSSMLTIFPAIDKRIHYHDQYRLVFKSVAFVVVDCCFAIKYKMNSQALRELLTDMFKATNSKEQPSHFIILDNHITDSEFDHKLNQFARGEYRGTQDKIAAYRAYQPKLDKDYIVKTRVPFTVTHTAMTISERKVRKKLAEDPSKKSYSRAGINDFSLIYMIDKIRRSFGLCARVALLSDDFGMLHYASTFYAPPSANASEKNGFYPNLPSEYVKPYIVTPFLLEPKRWNDWRHKHVHPYFANHIADA